MSKQAIHFAHANGFPGATYRALFEAMSSRFDVCYCEMLGHDPIYPITDNWPELVSELIADIRAQNNEKVIGVGHSLGGVLMLMAAIREPELFDMVIMLDAPVLSKLKRAVIKLAKQVDLIDQMTPARLSKNRRDIWPDRESAMAYLKSKTLFRPFAEQCLSDYIEYGMVQFEQGLRLKFQVANEYNIFRTLPHHISGMKIPLPVPIGLLYGREGDLISDKEARRMEKQYALLAMSVPGGHMFPFTDPQHTADSIHEMVQIIKA